jgi:hypothetical protein
MASLIKTWPAGMDARKVLTIFSEKKPAFPNYYFTLGRGRPKQEVERLFFTYRGHILGHFDVREIVRNIPGTLPYLHRIDGGPSDWQIKPYNWVAVCDPPFHRLKDKVFHDGFRGFHYFDLDVYRNTPESRMAI